MYRSHRFFTLGVLTLFFMLPSLSIIATTTAQDWSMLGSNPARTYTSTSPAPSSNNVLFKTSPYVVRGGLSVADGRVYAPLYSGLLYVLDAYTGEPLKAEAYQNMYNPPTIHNGRLYLASGSSLYCLDSSSLSMIWYYQTGGLIRSSPVTVDDKVYLTGYNQRIMCIDENGGLLWSYNTGSRIESSPAVNKGRVVFTTTDQKVYCFDADPSEDETDEGIIDISDGGDDDKTYDLIWVITGTSGFTGSPSILDEHVFLVSDDHTLYSLSLNNGAVEWSRAFDYQTTQTAVFSSYLLIGSGSTLHCLNPVNGKTIWERQLSRNSNIRSTPVISDNKVIVSDGYKLYCLQLDDGSEVWSYDNIYVKETGGLAVANGILYAASYNDGVIYGFYANKPPVTPDKPRGEVNGLLYESYQYSTNTVHDPDNDPVEYLFDWGDGTNSGWVKNPYATHIWINEGVYNIKVKARDNYHSTSTWSESLQVTISKQIVEYKLLEITTPSQVNEGESFTVMVSSENKPLPNIRVSFNNIEYLTDESGSALLTAPLVSYDTTLVIYATSDSYTSNYKKILIKDKTEEQNYGYIFGRITDEKGNPLPTAQICIIPEDKTKPGVWIKPDNDARFIYTLTPGDYVIHGEKTGYTSSDYEITIQKNNAYQVNIILQTTSSTTLTLQRDLFNTMLTQQTEKGNVAAVINVKMDQPTIEHLSDEVNIEIDKSTVNEFSFIVEGLEYTREKLFFLICDDTQFQGVNNVNDLVVIYDDYASERTSFQDLASTQSDKPRWAGLIVQDDDKKTMLIGLYIPSYSTHTITLKTITKSFNLIYLASVYTIAAVISMLIFASRIFTHPVYHNYFKKRLRR